MKLRLVSTTIALVTAAFFVSGQGLSQGINEVKIADSGLSADSLIQTYSVDELLKIQEYFKKQTDSLLQEKDALRQRGIRDMGSFVKLHAKSPILDKIIIRLAELYYEQAIHDYEVANDTYTQQLSRYENKEIAQAPEEPVKDYSRALSLYQRIIDEFPESTLVDDAIYSKGFLLEDLGKQAAAFEAYQTMIDAYPESHYVSDALMRMAEYYFNPPVNQIEKAIGLYKKILNYKDSSRYDAALYRLGWAYYRLSDFPSAISYFTILADDLDRAKLTDPQNKYHFPAVRDEALEYIGISFLDYGGPTRAADYFSKIGGRDYGLQVLKKIGDVYMDVKEEYDKAINAYQLLLSMYPNSPEAPKINAKLAEAYRNIEDERMAYVRREELYKKYKTGSEWWEKNQDEESRNDALVLAEKALRDNINLLLLRGKDSNDTNLYFQAINDSRDYLATFPENENTPLIHWNMALTLDEKLGMHDEAFDEYIKISNRYWNSRFQKPAAENAIAIADEAVRHDSLTSAPGVMPLNIGEIKAGLGSRDSLRKALELQEKSLTPEETRLASALDNYIKLFPDEPETAKILAKGGALYYERNRFKESVKYFKTLVKHFPDSPEVDYARYITLESYFGKADYRSAEIVAKTLRDISPEYAEKANRRLAESIFLQAKNLADSLEYLKAAEEYRRMVAESPDVEFADLALYNSALEYENAKEYRRAVESYTQLLNGYPQSEHFMNALNNLAFDYRELDDYMNAAINYEKLAKLEPDSAKAQAALYNASVSYVQIEEWERAIRVNNTYVERFPTAEDADNLLFNNANYYLKLNDISNANEIYAEFANKFPNSPRVVEAYYRRGEYFRANNLYDEAKAEFEKAVLRNDELKKLGSDTNDFYAAEALFLATQLKYNEFDAIEFKLPPAAMAENKTKKKKLLLDIVDSYTKVAGYGTVRLYEASYKIGLAYEEFARTWARQDIPPMDDTKRVVAQKEINQTAAELYERAHTAYKNSEKILTQLADKYRESVQPDTLASVSDKIVVEDTTLMVADKWIKRCREKISQTLYDIAEINYASVEKLLNAAPPAGIQNLEALVYRNQVLIKVINPLIEDIVAAHTRNIEEGAALGLDNQWIESSKGKIISTSNITPNEFTRLAHEAASQYGEFVKTYEKLIEAGDETAFDVADQMSNVLEFGKSYALAAAKGFRQTIEKARSLDINKPEVAATEENLFKSISDYSRLSESLADESQSKLQYYQKLYEESDRIDYQDASFTFDENHNILVDGTQEILQYGYQTSQDLSIQNSWVGKVTLALVRLNPEENAGILDLTIATEHITTNATWLAASNYSADWTAPGFVDSLWSQPEEEGSYEKLSESDSKRIWLVFQTANGTTADSIRTAATDSLSSKANRVAKAYFRKSFEVAGLPVSGIVQLFVDDSYKLYLNGEYVEQFNADSTQEVSVRAHDVSAFLRSGRNVLAIEVTDRDKSSGGLEADLEIKSLPDWFDVQKKYDASFEKANPDTTEFQEKGSDNNKE